MSSIYFTGYKIHDSCWFRVYKEGEVTEVIYGPYYKSTQYSISEINTREGKLKISESNSPKFGETVVEGKDYSILKYNCENNIPNELNKPTPEDSDWSLSEIWEDYSMYIIGVSVLIAAIIAFLVYRNMGATQVVENIAAAFGLV